MAHIWPCVLLLLSSLLSCYGHSEEIEAVLTLEPNQSHIFTGESVTFKCDMKEGRKEDWQYTFYHKAAGDGDAAAPGGVNTRPGLQLDRGTTVLPTGHRAALADGDEVTTTTEEEQDEDDVDTDTNNLHTLTKPEAKDSGQYWCTGVLQTDDNEINKTSNKVTLIVSATPRTTLTSDKTRVLTSDSVTLNCTVEDSTASWNFSWYRRDKTSDPVKVTEESTYTFWPASITESGRYWCRGGRGEPPYYTHYSSDSLYIFVSAKPNTTLKSDRTSVLKSNSVTLTCTVEDNSWWEIYWYRHSLQSEPVKMQAWSTYLIWPTESGSYWCRGGTGDPPYYTHYSNPVNITVSEQPVPILSRHPNWPVIYMGETIILKCAIQEESASVWEYAWWKNYKNIKISEEDEFEIGPPEIYPSGPYACKGRHKNDQQLSNFSNTIDMSFEDKPKPLLRLSPPWLSPGDSVTLSCNFKESSAGWRFSWYRAVPKPSGNTYMYEPLPGSHNGTVEGSYTIHDPTGTGGYMCIAGRGNPVYYTKDSEPQFVWSGDLHSSASLTVSPNRTQHFTFDSVSLSCEGNSTEWSMRKYNKFSRLKMTESTWTKYALISTDSGVYWCESGLGEYSNAVNITVVHFSSVILVSPVRPVTEGHSVTLHCKHRIDLSLSNVDFYRNEELVQNATNGELIIPAVSKSDEGFYKCKYSGLESPQSWMAVRLSHPATTGPVEQSSLNVVGLFVGLLVVILLTIALLLLCRYRTAKDPCCVRSVKSQGTNQDAAADQRTNHGGSPDNGHSPLQHDEAAAEPSDVTYSQIELKHMGKKKKEKSADPLESSLYSEVKIGSATGSGEADVTYAQVNHQNKGKVKNKKAPETTEDTVYSQVKPGTALG